MSKPHDTPRLGPIKRICAETGVPYTSMRDVVHRHEIPVIRVGRAWYLDRRDVERWIEQRKERA